MMKVYKRVPFTVTLAEYYPGLSCFTVFPELMFNPYLHVYDLIKSPFMQIMPQSPRRLFTFTLNMQTFGTTMWGQPC